MLQLILHLIGDYVTQSDWMAQNKTKRSWPALCHAVVYSLPFLLVTQSPAALAVICGTHFLIDRFRLARYVVWAKNVLLQPSPCPAKMHIMEFNESNFGETDPELTVARDHRRKWSWKNCSGTGYPSDAPPWLAVWLLIAADNTLHLAINYAAIRWL
jgi:hypothetical protein